MMFKINTKRHSSHFLLITILLHVFLLVNTQFTLWPEMVVYPYLFNNGFLLYKDIINPYPPFLTVSLSLFGKMFGYWPLPYSILTWIYVVVIDILVFIIAKLITKKTSFGILSSLFFILFSIPFGVNGLWFDLVQTPIILVSFYLFYQFLQDKKFHNLFWSFFVLTLAIFIKQQVAWLFFWFLVILVIYKKLDLIKDLKQILFIFFPLSFLSLVHVIVFFNLGTLKEFLFWNVVFPSLEVSKAPGYILMPTKIQLLTVTSLFLIFIPIFFSKEDRLKIIAFTSLFLIIFAYPRFDYFHLIPALAILSLAFGPLVSAINKIDLKLKIVSLTALILSLSFNARYLANNMGLPTRFFEPEILAAARLTSFITKPEDRLYIQNGPDQILPLLQRLPIKPWADEFPWYLETVGLQKEVVNGIRDNDPKYIIFKPYSNDGKYVLGSYKPDTIATYIDENYQNSFKINDSLWLKTKK